MEVKKLFVFISLSAALMSCGSDASTEDVLDENTVTDTTSKDIEQQKISAQNVFNSIPGPSELTRLIEDAGLDYDPAVPSDPSALHKYTSDNFKALNLGVYGA